MSVNVLYVETKMQLSQRAEDNFRGHKVRQVRSNVNVIMTVFLSSMALCIMNSYLGDKL